jgi:hypothetical protein
MHQNHKFQWHFWQPLDTVYSMNPQIIPLQYKICWKNKYNLFKITNIPYNSIFTTKFNDSSILISTRATQSMAHPLT